ncbi:MAG: AAA family ATPase [Gaiella sp.]
MSMFGRDHELDVLNRLITDGVPSAIVLEGPPGIGKTTLLLACLEQAAAAGIPVLRSAPSPPEQGLAFAGLSDLLAGHVPALDALPAPQLRALRVALQLENPGTKPVDASAIAFATLGALVALTSESPLLVAIDDSQWLDRGSADALSFALRRIDMHRVRTLLVRRVDPDSTVAPSLELALTGLAATVLTLGPLSIGAVQHVIRARLGTALSRPQLHRVHATSAGNPLFAIELARVLPDIPPPIPAEPPPLPSALRDLIERRLLELPRDTEQALQVAALLPEPSLRLVEQALGHVAELDPAVRAGIVELHGDTIRWAHPLLASGLADRLDGEARRLLHKKLAAIAGSSEERAFHLLAATSEPDAAAAASVEEAAAAARSRGASATAADLFSGSLSLTAPDDTGSLHRRQLATSEAARDSGDWRRAERHARAAVALAPAGPDRAEALITLATTSPSLQLEAAEEALAHTENDPRLAARAHLLVGDVLFHRDAARAIEANRRALEAALLTDDDGLQAAARSAVAYLEEACLAGDPLVHLPAAVEVERGGIAVLSDFSPEMTIATVHMWRDEHEQASDGFARVAAAAAARGDIYGVTLADHHLAMVDWRAGRWNQALAMAERAVSSWEASGDPAGTSTVLYGRAFILAHLGKEESSLADVAAAREAGAPGSLMGARLDWVEGHVALVRGDHTAAATLLGRAATVFDQLGLAHPGLRLYLSDAIEAFVLAERPDDAQAIALPLVELGERHHLARASVIGLRGQALVLGAGGEIDEAIRQVERAVGMLEAFPVPFEHARTWLALGALERRARRRRAARTSLERALVLFEQLGAEAWTGLTRSELARIGGRAPSNGGLTPTEQRVAALVAEGKSNKEVAAVMVVSVHTVEAALTSIYRKLNVRSRTELGRKLSARS